MLYSDAVGGEYIALTLWTSDVGTLRYLLSRKWNYRSLW